MKLLIRINNLLAKMNYKNFNTGFSLIELMTVIAILSIMAGIAIPNIISYLPRYRLRNAAQGLLGDMQSAKLNAVKSNSDWAIVFDTANNRYFICSDQGVDGDWTGPNDSTGGGDNTIHKTVLFDTYKGGVVYGHGALGTAVTPGGFGPNSVFYTSETATFNPRGTGKFGYVYLTNSKGELVFAVGTNTTGVITMKFWNGSAWI